MRCALYNALSGLAAGRLQQIVSTLNADVCFLTGLRIPARKGQPYEVRRVGRFDVFLFGWCRGPYTNKSAGCAIAIGRRVRAKHVVRVTAPPESLRGRGGALRVKAGSFDLTLVVGYAPPPTGLGGAQEAQVKAATLVVEWMKEQYLKAPQRSTPIAAGDFNSGVGLDEEFIKVEGTGDHRLARANAAGLVLHSWLAEADACVPGTFSARVGPTFYGPTGATSTADHL